MWWILLAVSAVGAVGLALWVRRKSPNDNLTSRELSELARPISQLETEADRYFSKFIEVSEREKSGDYDGALAAAWDALREFRKVANDLGDTFRSPPFDYVCTHAVLMRSQNTLDQMRGLLEQQKCKNLRQFDRQLAAYQETFDVFSHVYNHISENPGALQRSLGKVLSEDGRTISTWVKRAEKRGILRREVSGKTFALYVADK
jgi:hypothetical protein